MLFLYLIAGVEYVESVGVSIKEGAQATHLVLRLLSSSIMVLPPLSINLNKRLNS